MDVWKYQVLRLIELRARRRVANLAGSYLKAKPQEREAVIAGIEIERWLAETCWECRQ